MPSGVGVAMATEPLIEFVEVQITHDEFLNPLPEHCGERVKWSDGTLHGVPESTNGPIIVLRRVQYG